MRVLLLLCLGGLVLTLGSCSAPTSGYDKPTNETRIKGYNRFNIHYEEKGPGTLKASYANYTAAGRYHGFLPVGTPMVIDFSGGMIKMYLEDGRRVDFIYSRRNMDMPMPDYVALISSEVPVSIDTFAGVDKQGIQQGKALVGMTKAGVMTALGYPATHKTPSPDSDSWVFWTNRWGTIRVDFDEQGLVSNIVD